MAVKKQNTAVRTGAYMVRTTIRTLLYVVAAMAILRGATWSYSFGYAIFSNQTMAKEGAGRDVYVTVGADDTVKDVAKLLKKERLIKDTLVFEVQEKLSTYKDKIQPGTYILNTEQTAEEMLAILSGTDTQGQPGTDSESSTAEGKSAS